jgi:anti-anti-sigma regulatory factor
MMGVFLEYFINRLTFQYIPADKYNIEEENMNLNTLTDYTVIDIPSRISPDLLPSIEQKYDHFIRETGASYLLNMEKVENLYSTTLSLIMHIYKIVNLMGGTLSMVNVSPQIRTAVTFMKIDEKISMFSTIIDYESEHLNTAAIYV